MFEAIRSLIEQYDTIILHRHSSPDGDALGSQIGLKHLILANYPSKQVWMVGDAAGRYAFMTDSVMDVIPDAAYATALAILLDTSARKLISDTRFTLAAATARIDHHLFVERIAQTEVTDSSYESCCGMVAHMAEECGWLVPDVAAEALYTGMVTDSGRFRYDSTSARTFRLAAGLREHTFDINRLHANLYASPLEEVKRRAAFTQKIALTAHGVAYIYTTLAEREALGMDLFSVSRGMVGVMNDIQDVEIWVNFTEDRDGVACELRSSRQNINPIAVKYGGGGHQKASGAMVKDREEAMRMLDDLDRLAAEG